MTGSINGPQIEDVHPTDLAARGVSTDQRYLVSRSQVLELGGDSALIKRRLDSGRWVAVQPGVYQLDVRDRSWRDDLMAAILSVGDSAAASHRAAMMLWGLDGIYSAPIELTVSHEEGPTPQGAVLHRTRRPAASSRLDDIPVTSVERTLLDSCAILPELVMTKAVESALRKRLTTLDRLFDFLKMDGGRGVKGTRLLRRILEARRSDTPTASGAETEALYQIRQSDIPEPVLQKRFRARDGTPIVPDFYWPYAHKAVEIDGLDAHDSADKLDHDLLRQNKLMDLGIELRRFSARLVRRDPYRFVADVRRFLEPDDHSGRKNSR